MIRVKDQEQQALKVQTTISNIMAFSQVNWYRNITLPTQEQADAELYLQETWKLIYVWST